MFRRLSLFLSRNLENDMSNKFTFISKYRNFGITLPGGARVKFQDNLFVTEDASLADKLRASSVCGKDFSETTPSETEEAKGKKK